MLVLNLFVLSTTGLVVTEEQLEEVAKESGVLRVLEDFLTEECKEECECLIPDKDTIKLDEWTTAYLYLKDKSTLSI